MSKTPTFVSEAVPAAVPEQPSPVSSPPAAPAAGGEGLAIIGRYESEGTTYVMYADGSIEARSERGVFHFKSMAELTAAPAADEAGLAIVGRYESEGTTYTKSLKV